MSRGGRHRLSRPPFVHGRDPTVSVLSRDDRALGFQRRPVADPPAARRSWWTTPACCSPGRPPPESTQWCRGTWLPATATTAAWSAASSARCRSCRRVVTELARSAPSRPVDAGPGGGHRARRGARRRCPPCSPGPACSRRARSSAPRPPDVDAVWLERVSEFVPDEVVAVVEPRRPLDGRRRTAPQAWLEAVRRVAEHGCTPKIRMGGPRASDVPTVDDVYSFLETSLEHGKGGLSAQGLDRIVRDREETESDRGRHGLVNLIVAVARMTGVSASPAPATRRPALDRPRGTRPRAGRAAVARRRARARGAAPRAGSTRSPFRSPTSSHSACSTEPGRGPATVRCVTRIGFLGPHATFTEQAVRSLPESDGRRARAAPRHPRRARRRPRRLGGRRVRADREHAWRAPSRRCWTGSSRTRRW